MKFAPLITAFVLMTTAATLDWLFPLATRKVLLPLAMAAGVVGATVIAATRLKRASPPPSHLAAAVFSYFTAASVASLGFVHAVGVIMVSIDRARAQPFVYNFRYYSLIMLGVLLLVTGLMAVNQVDGLARGERVAWRSSLLVWAAILAIALPLHPLQDLAIIPATLAFLELLILGGMWGNFRARSESNT